MAGTAVTLLAFVVIWYILGFAFFAMLYAAFGSLVSRQEDVNSATMPLSILAFASFFTAQSALSDPDATWIRILAWIPPFSSMIMPMRIAAGVTSPFEMVATVADHAGRHRRLSDVRRPDLRELGAQHRRASVAQERAQPMRSMVPRSRIAVQDRSTIAANIASPRSVRAP